MDQWVDLYARLPVTVEMTIVLYFHQLYITAEVPVYFSFSHAFILVWRLYLYCFLVVFSRKILFSNVANKWVVFLKRLLNSLRQRRRKGKKKKPDQYPTLSTPKQINNQSPALPPTLCSDPVLIQHGSSWINGQKCTYNGPISHPPLPPHKGASRDWRCHSSELPGVIDFMQSSINLCSHRVTSAPPEFWALISVLELAAEGRERTLAAPLT